MELLHFKDNGKNRDVISLFSGAMGLDIGLAKAGLNIAIERFVLIGSRDNEDIFLPIPTHFQMHQDPAYRWQTLRDSIKDLEYDCGECAAFSQDRLAFLRLVPEGGNWKDLPPEGLGLLLQKLEYNALSPVARKISDFGVPYKLIDCYDSQRYDKGQFDAYERHIDEQISNSHNCSFSCRAK